MSETVLRDPFWRAASDHLSAQGIAGDAVLAPREFAAFAPACRAIEELEDSEDLDDARALEGVEALVVHKGWYERIPACLLAAALERLAPSFANEVFVVLTRGGDRLPHDHEHLRDWGKILLHAYQSAQDTEPLGFAASVPPVRRGTRMPACYLGKGRVLLETAFAHLMFVDGADNAIVPHLIRDGFFDRNLTILIGSLLDEGMVFIDVGANLGTYTLLGAERVGSAGRVIAIEPSPSIGALLQANVEVNGFKERARVFRCAVGAREEVVTLYEFSTQRGSNTLLESIAEDARREEDEEVVAREVECRRLDDIVAEAEPRRIDLVKIDVEGFEHEVLLGARASLQRFRPRLILEWHRSFFEGRPGSAEALYELLTDQLGYRLRRIGNEGRTFVVDFGQLMAFDHSDILAEPKEGEGNS